MRKKLQREISRQKTQPLSSRDLEESELKRHVELALERALMRSSTPAEHFWILDVGCGRGTTVALLRQRGWKAFGAEIDQHQTALARTGLEALGHNPGPILDISPEGVIDAEDGSFDFLISEQVVEHVENLETFVQETWRVLKPEGSALHVYPARWRPLEPHIRQPFVHWLPHGFWRSVMIRFWLYLGVESGSLRVGVGPRTELAELSKRARAHAYEEYLRSKTRYRSQSEIDRAFLEKFAGLDHQVVGDTIAATGGLRLIARAPLMKRLLQQLCVRFFSAAVLVQK